MARSITTPGRWPTLPTANSGRPASHCRWFIVFQSPFHALRVKERAAGINSQKMVAQIGGQIRRPILWFKRCPIKSAPLSCPLIAMFRVEKLRVPCHQLSPAVSIPGLLRIHRVGYAERVRTLRHRPTTVGAFTLRTDMGAFRCPRTPHEARQPSANGSIGGELLGACPASPLENGCFGVAPLRW